MPTSFRDYAVYCYKTNNTNALFSKFNYDNSIFIEGVMKMSSHLCYEFTKSILKCDCRRRKKSILYQNDGKKPIWMQHSAFNFNHKKSTNIKHNNSSSIVPHNT